MCSSNTAFSPEHWDSASFSVKPQRAGAEGLSLISEGMKKGTNAMNSVKSKAEKNYEQEVFGVKILKMI